MELLNGLCGIKFNNLVSRLPDKGISIGGRMLLEGNYISLACFHGTNFRSQNWALFTILEPSVKFSTETRGVEKSCQVMRARCSQELTLSLGHNKPSVSEKRKSTSNLHGMKLLVFHHFGMGRDKRGDIFR